MIYGQFAKSMNNTNVATVDESNIIISELFGMRNEYNNILINESYISDDERVVYEAKLQVINEAVTVAIIAALIAILGVVAGLLVLLSKLMKGGGAAASESSKKTVAQVEAQIKKEEQELLNKDYEIEKEFDEAIKKSRKQFKIQDEEPKVETSKKEQKSSNTIQTKSQSFKIHDEVKKRVDNKDIRGLQYVFVDCLDVDPTFEKYEEDYAYCCKNAPEMFDEHEELKTPLTNDQGSWNDDYWNKLKIDLLKNFSKKRFEHMRKVAQVYYADKIKRLRKERRQSTEPESGEPKQDKDDMDLVNPNGSEEPKTEEPKQDKPVLNTKQLKKEFKQAYVAMEKEAIQDIKNGIFGEWARGNTYELFNFEKVSTAGVSMYDFSKVINGEAIKNFTMLVRKAANDTINPQEIKLLTSEEDKNDATKSGRVGRSDDNGNQMRALSDEAVEYLKKTRTLFFTDEVLEECNKDNAINVLRKIWANNVTSGTDLAAERALKMIDKNGKCSLYDAAINKIDKMNKDIEVLKATLERLKKDNYNVDRMKQSNNFDNTKEKFAESKDVYIQNMLKIERDAVNMFCMFTKEWEKIEKYRLTTIKTIRDVITRNISKICKSNVWFNMRKKYGENTLESAGITKEKYNIYYTVKPITIEGIFSKNIDNYMTK